MTVCPDFRSAFPHTTEFVVHGETTLYDVDFNPGCGYVSRQEGELLHAWATLYPGVWVEIGSHTGWSGAHIASAADVELVAIEPQYDSHDFRKRTLENWARANVTDSITPVASTSAAFFELCAGTVYAGAFIDGDHDGTAPLDDARMVLPHLADDAVVLFHDNVGQPVADAVGWLEAQGFWVERYETMAKLTACWRGARRHR